VALENLLEPRELREIRGEAVEPKSTFESRAATRAAALDQDETTIIWND
jgi:hypothetical protein